MRQNKNNALAASNGSPEPQSILLLVTNASPRQQMVCVIDVEIAQDWRKNMTGRHPVVVSEQDVGISEEKQRFRHRDKHRDKNLRIS